MRKSTPLVTLAGAAAIASLLVAVVVCLATRQPWLGLALTVGENNTVLVAETQPSGPAATVPAGATLLSLSASGLEPVAPDPRDLLEEPDQLPTYVEFGEFLARQDRLAALLRADSVTLHLDANRNVTIRPAASRPLSSLPTAFWVQLFVGAASFVIGAWVWSLRRGDLATRILVGVGASTLIFSFAASTYSTRELALEGGLFRALSALNHFGALAFGACMIALFLSYPRRLVAPRWLLLLPAIIFPWWLADTLRLGFAGTPTGSHLPTMLEMLGILAAAALQFWKTRGDPRARAALRWFALSVAIGAGAFVFLVVAPNLFGAAPVLSQGYAFLFFLLVFVGVALGVARYRLFELETWAFRVLFYLGGVALLLALDSTLIFAAAMDRTPALGLSLAVVALLYLPLRDLLARRILSRRDSRAEIFRPVLDVALTAPGGDQGARWRSVLQTLFDPLRIESGETVSNPEIRDEGDVLALPAVAPLCALRLVHARGGRRLFSRADAALATEVCALLRHAIESRTAYEKGVAEERTRIARDLHDNLGAQLLGALHSPAPERKDAKIRESLGELRGIINDASRAGQSLDDALAELRHETAERLAAAGVALDWRADAATTAPLSSATQHALRSILRETVSNALKHARATAVSIVFEASRNELSVVVADNGRGLPADAGNSSGRGLVNIRERLGSLGGDVAIEDALPGLRLRLRIPLANVTQN